MVAIRKRIKGERTYYYLEHSYRKGRNVLKKEKYVGDALPTGIELLKKEFLHEIYRERWYTLFEKIKKRWREELNHTPPSAKEKEIESFKVRFTYDTQRIEGSKLTLKETANLLEKGITPAAKPIADVKEAEAHAKLFREILEYGKNLTLPTALFWHKRLFHETKPDIAGKVRRHGVMISGSKFMPPSPVEVEPLLQDFFEWYKRSYDTIHPIELAALVHLKLATVHPFADGNGRIGRLLMNFVLHKKGFPLLNITYQNRSSYYTALERAQIKQNEAIFAQWFFKRYLKEHMRLIEKPQLQRPPAVKPRVPNQEAKALGRL